jgi:MoaA/NifB/PqqE/SkfB family radical SAM enzyme
MSIARFGSMLISKGQFHGYMKILRNDFQEANLPSVMCRTLVSVDWRGYVYDCDFNQMLGLPLAVGKEPRTHIAELLEQDLEGEPITVAAHCYGCTAGQGSSCSGALAKPEQKKEVSKV